VSVVFDGRPVELEAVAAQVLFASSRGRNAADRDIAELVEGDPEPASISVVTSDAELAERVRAAGARVIGSGGFQRTLDDF
jgi:uncharacterized protein YaiI (UPF0178 family)